MSNKIKKTDYKDYYHADINKTFTHKEGDVIKTGSIIMTGDFETSDIRQVIGWLDNPIG